MTGDVDEHHTVRRVNRMRTHDAHAILRLLRVPTWSLMLVGRRVRTWGYIDGGPTEHTWTEFSAHPYNDEFLAALERRKAV
jgi:hypothetical protein